MYSSRKHRNQRQVGGSAVLLIAILAFTVLGLVGILCYELQIANLGQQQLQNSVDAAALTAVATLASQDNSNPAAAHDSAVKTALDLFKKNVVMGVALNNTIVGSAPNSSPTAGHAALFFEFINPQTDKVEPATSPLGKVVRVYGDLGIQPAFGRYLGVGPYVIHTISQAAVPELDVVLCFDISGSMDDQTPVTLVKRKWDSSLSKIVYDVPSGAQYGTKGSIYNIDQPGENGTSLNAVPPQVLSMAVWNDKLYFSEPTAAFNSVPGLRSGGVYPEAGAPPGNYPPGTAPTWDGYPVFTDQVTNLDGNTTFGGFSADGYSFPDVATLVEASRGNLENAAVFDSSKSSTSVSVSPQPGYQAEYFKLAKQILEPLVDARNACQNFADMLNTDTDAHFGFVAFDQAVGTSPSDTETRYDIDDDELSGLPPYGKQVKYPLPMVPLNSKGNSGYSSLIGALNSCVPIGGTNLGAALQAAVTELTTHQRPGATRAIILFTDGEPTYGNPLDADPWKNTRDAAVLARNAGIPVYTVGLAQDPSVQIDETAILNDANADPTTGGVAAISGHGATFSLVTNNSQLKGTFEKIARRLVQLVTNE